MKRAARTLIVAASAVASLALTYGAWQAAHEQSEREDRLRFDLRVEDIASSLRGRMLDYEQVLFGHGPAIPRGGREAIARLGASSHTPPDHQHLAACCLAGWDG